jgi:endonuclease/exonuclease/phosphatase family metal-dependent hydrolase
LEMRRLSLRETPRMAIPRDPQPPPVMLVRLLQWFRGLPPAYQLGMLLGIALVVLLLVALAAFFLYQQARQQPPAARAGPPGSYLFCTWNAENFFDDEDDPENHDEMENWFGRDPGAFRLKVDHLSDALLLMNDGKGPDIVSLCEVENVRCMDALRDALNAKLEAAGQSNARYENVLFKQDRSGRRFAPGILTRLPVVADKTRQLGSGGLHRILEGHVRVNDHELVVITAHWTSRLHEGTADHRFRYAESCYGRARQITTANPDADVIVCGDFNDEFADRSLQEGLHASDDPQAVLQARNTPLLFDLCAHLDARLDPKGTIYGNRHWSIFDHICVSRGLLDTKGWSCDPQETEIFAPHVLRTGVDRRPFSFGSARQLKERGYGDHFPVVTRLHVEGNEEPAP